MEHWPRIFNTWAAIANDEHGLVFGAADIGVQGFDPVSEAVGRQELQRAIDRGGLDFTAIGFHCDVLAVAVVMIEKGTGRHLHPFRGVRVSAARDLCFFVEPWVDGKLAAYSSGKFWGKYSPRCQMRHGNPCARWNCRVSFRSVQQCDTACSRMRGTDSCHL